MAASKLMSDFELAYADTIRRIFSQWMHDEDSGCDYSAVGQRQVYEYGDIMVIYQPNEAEGWCEKASIIFTVTKEARAAGKKIDAKLLASCNGLIQHVNKLLYDAYTNFLTISKNKWFNRMTKNEYDTYQDFMNELCEVTSPLKFDKGVIKFAYTIQYYYMEYGINYWYPLELIEAMKEFPSYAPYKEAEKRKTEEELRAIGLEPGDGLVGGEDVVAEVPYIEDSMEQLQRLIDRGCDVQVPTIKEKLSGYKRMFGELGNEHPVVGGLTLPRGL